MLLKTLRSNLLMLISSAIVKVLNKVPVSALLLKSVMFLTKTSEQ